MGISGPAIDPPSVCDDGKLISCVGCDEEFELPADSCPDCGAGLDEDDIRDQIEASNEPPEWG